MKPLIITLDGPSGSGKSTASLKLAYHFNLPCLDTGAMYRTVALKAIESKIPLDDSARLAELASQIHFDFGFEGEDFIVSYRWNGKEYRAGKEIRTPEVSLAASTVAKMPALRKVLVSQQQEIGARKGAVVEGRDAGTVIFPRANIKFFMTASLEERARRRTSELVEKLGSEAPPYQEVLREMISRDDQDAHRAASPLKPAEDSIMVDTTGLSFDEVVVELIRRVETRLSHPSGARAQKVHE